jgi:hypothetical protein
MGLLTIFMDPKVAKGRPQSSIPLTFELFFFNASNVCSISNHHLQQNYVKRNIKYGSSKKKKMSQQ